MPTYLFAPIALSKTKITIRKFDWSIRVLFCPYVNPTMNSQRKKSTIEKAMIYETPWPVMNSKLLIKIAADQIVAVNDKTEAAFFTPIGHELVLDNNADFAITYTSNEFLGTWPMGHVI